MGGYVAFCEGTGGRVREMAPKGSGGIWKALQYRHEVVQPEFVGWQGILSQKGDEGATCHAGAKIARSAVLEIRFPDPLQAQFGPAGGTPHVRNDGRQLFDRAIGRAAIDDEDFKTPRRT